MLQSNEPENENLLSVDQLIENVYSRLSKNERERFSLDDVAKILSNLELQNFRSEMTVPRLIIQRLIFAGEKTLKNDGQSRPFVYDQRFVAGVNIVLIPNNDVGKSSIMKTVRFALTGDDDNYDADVKSWIKQIWLQFSVDSEDFTIYIRAGNQPRGVLATGKREEPLDNLLGLTGKHFDVVGYTELQNRLQQFFFDRLGLNSFSWTQKDPSNPQGVSERKASWQTFFQALLIPDRSDDYLLCDGQHAMGNQDGLILSTFLGLHLIEPMNQLGVSKALIAKQDSTNTQSNTEIIQSELEQWQIELENTQQELQATKAKHHARVEQVKNQKAFQQLPEISTQIIEVDGERKQLQESLADTSSKIKKTQRSIRGLQEVIDFKRHFTGLEVSICPNCDTTVEEGAVQNEKESCECRLCGKMAVPISPEDAEGLEEQLNDREGYLKKNERIKQIQTKRLKNLDQKYLALEQEYQALQETVLTLGSLAPTVDEETKFTELYQRIGQLNAQINAAQKQLMSVSEATDLTSFQIRVLTKAREMLAKRAEIMNASTLNRLSTATQTLADLIGTESITDLNCSALGKISLKKHGTKVSFSSINNPGERVRVKLAFFLSLIQLGREPGVGKHPGLLLIDQLASSEMVQEDCRALAEVLHKIDNKFHDTVQVICFTAEPEFAKATAPEKVYGAQAEDGYAF